MNGRVNGTINGVTIPDEVYLHTFIMGGGGRTFTAISPVPSSIAYSMQILLPIGELMGWMFAEPAAKGINGFMQTGENYLKVSFQMWLSKHSLMTKIRLVESTVERLFRSGLHTKLNS